MSVIYKEAVCLGISPETEVNDFKAAPAGLWDKLKAEGTLDKFPKKKAVRVSFLAVDFGKHSAAHGYQGDLKLQSFDIAPDDKEALKLCKPEAKLLLKLDQRIGTDGQNKGKSYEEFLSVQPITTK